MADSQSSAAVLEPVRARAIAKYVHMSPTKVRRVVALIKGRPVAEALDILRFTPHAAARPLFKVVASAAANAENNLDLDRDTLVVAAAYADEGPTLKRIRPRAQGRAFRIRKRTSHITVIVESRPARGERSGRSASSTRSRRAQGSKAAAANKAPAKKGTLTKATTEPAKKATAEKASGAAKAATSGEAKKSSESKDPAKKAPAKKAAKKAPAKKASDEAKGGSQ